MCRRQTTNLMTHPQYWSNKIHSVIDSAEN